MSRKSISNDFIIKTTIVKFCMNFLWLYQLQFLAHKIWPIGNGRGYPQFSHVLKNCIPGNPYNQ